MDKLPGDVNTFGKAVRYFRHQQQMTQRQLAEATGVAVGVISDIECGRRRTNKIAVLARALHVELSLLMSYDDRLPKELQNQAVRKYAKCVHQWEVVGADTIHTTLRVRRWCRCCGTLSRLCMMQLQDEGWRITDEVLDVPMEEV